MKVGFTDGHINTTQMSNYSFVISNSASAYYRLKQIDIDGKFTHSPIRYVGGVTVFAVYPNPTAGELHLQIEDVKQTIQVSLTNAGGKQVVNGQGKVREVEAILSEQLSKLSAGVYVLQVRIGAKLHIKKVVKAP